MADKGRPLPKFGEWDVNNPATAEGFTVIFNKARDEKKTGAGKITAPTASTDKNQSVNDPPPSPPRSKWFCCVGV